MAMRVGKSGGRRVSNVEMDRFMSEDEKIVAARTTWESAAPGWAKWEEKLSAGLVKATDELLDMAGIGMGARVLDVACGAGYQTLQAARRVGPGGSVVASDISPIMLDHVRRNAAVAGLANITTVESAAERLPVADVPYDAAISRLGLMLFPDAAAAVDAVRKTLKPGGRFAALVFTTPANNPFTARPMSILLRHACKQPPGPGSPGIFALGGDGALSRQLSDGGLQSVETRVVTATLRLASADEALEMIQEAFGAYRAVIAGLDEAAKAAAWAEVLNVLREMEGGQGFATDFEFIIGSGAAA